MSKLAPFVALIVLATSSAAAATITLRATGRVTNLGAIQNENSVAMPPGAIIVGDIFAIVARFDLALAELTSFYDADPSTNVYFLPGMTISYSIGSYSPVFPPLHNVNASTQLWDNLDLGGAPIDSQTFSFLDYNVTPVSTLPFDLGEGQQSVFLDLYAFDMTGLARSNDLISDYAPFSAFGSRSFGFGQFNSETNVYAFVNGDIDSWTLSVIPEPDRWAMMILGLGAVGISLRRRNRRRGDVSNQTRGGAKRPLSA